MRKRIWSAAVLVAAAAGLAARGDEGATKPAEKAAPLPFTISKETTGIVEPLRADGMPDYVAAMNAKYGKGVKGDENMVTAWLQVVGTGDKVLPEKERGKFLELSGGKEAEGMKWFIYWEFLRDQGMEHQAIGNFVGEEIRARGRVWSENDFPKLAEYVKARKDYLDASAEAFGKGKYWMPSVAGDGVTLNTVTFQPLGRLRETLGVLGERATMRMKGGDFEGFMKDVGMIERAGRRMELGGSLSERLSGLSTDGMCSRMIGAAAGSGMLTQGQCVTLWKMMEGLDEPATLEEVENVCGRWLILERAELVATGKGEMLNREPQGNGVMLMDTCYPLWTTIDADAVNWDAALKRINGLVDEKIGALKKATIQDLLALESNSPANTGRVAEFGKHEGESREDYTERMAKTFVEMALSNLARPEISQREAEFQRKMARVVVALAAYKAEKGKWPERLKELKSGFLKEIPRDIYSEGEKAEILYAQGDSGARVYSVGFNGVDDGGVKDDAYMRGTGADDIVVGAGVDQK